MKFNKFYSVVYKIVLRIKIFNDFNNSLKKVQITRKKKKKLLVMSLEEKVANLVNAMHNAINFTF